MKRRFILTNYKNELLNDVLKNMKPKIYNQIIQKSKDFTNVMENSYKLQRNLTNSKSEFANELLYNNDIIEKEVNKIPGVT